MKLGSSRASIPVFLLQLFSATSALAACDVLSVSFGPCHALEVRADGTAWWWGSSEGCGSPYFIATPLQVMDGNDPVTDIIASAAGDGFSLLLRADGTVLGWGRNDLHQAGQISPAHVNYPTPVPLPGLVVAIAAGESHALALTEQGLLFAWGSNDWGQLGLGSVGGSSPPAQVTDSDLDLIRPLRIAAGASHSIVLRADGKVFAWGSNEVGQVGGPYPLAAISSPVSVTDGCTSVAAGSRHSLALTAGGVPLAWGLNASGQLGVGATDLWIADPALVPLSRVKALAAGMLHSLFLVDTGEVLAAGTGDAIGQASPGPQLSPAPVGGPAASGRRAVVAGGRTSAAVGADGAVLAWGDNSSGQLCLGTLVPSSTPIPMPAALACAPVAGGLSIDGGAGSTVLLRADGTVWSTGNNGQGQLGLGAPSPPVFGLSEQGGESIAVALGDHFGLRLNADGTVSAWGRNAEGQLGLGDLVDRHAPTQIPGFSGVVMVSAARRHALALKSDGSVWAWGSNGAGQLGTGLVGGVSATPVQVMASAGSPLLGAKAISAGSEHSIAHLVDGTIATWGGNRSCELGRGISVPAGAPQPVPGRVRTPAGASNDRYGRAYMRFREVLAAGIADIDLPLQNQSFTLGTTDDGVAWSWGGGLNGQLSHQPLAFPFQPQPTRVSPALTSKQLAGGHWHSLWLGAAGGVRASGRDSQGQVGNVVTPNVWLHVPVLDLALSRSVGAGAEHSLAIGADGCALGWGSNAAGALGTAPAGPQPVPVNLDSCP